MAASVRLLRSVGQQRVVDSRLRCGSVAWHQAVRWAHGHSPSELDAAIREMNSEMAELFGTASPAAMSSQSPLSHSAESLLQHHTSPSRPASILEAPASGDTEATRILHEKIAWATEELASCKDASRVTSLAECISACARAASDLGSPFPGTPQL
mmetsp:Transcript_2317/g.7430  ORF Transcript_2317/g.7430 Transcript_2317/m.7430 type:complete len:155 (-) Transcript_2317:187-651(-)|eukprot:scaffold246181_cov32-Tisochrysis_lutea.AAC.1